MRLAADYVDEHENVLKVVTDIHFMIYFSIKLKNKVG